MERCFFDTTVTFNTSAVLSSINWLNLLKERNRFSWPVAFSSCAAITLYGKSFNFVWRLYEQLGDQYHAADLIILISLFDFVAYCQEYPTVSPPIVLVAFHSDRPRALILFHKIYQQGNELRLDVESAVESSYTPVYLPLLRIYEICSYARMLDEPYTLFRC